MVKRKKIRIGCLILAFLLFLPIQSVFADPPVSIESIEPPYGPPGTDIVLSGENLVGTGVPTVRICDQDSPDVILLPDEMVQAQAPSHSMGISQWCDVEIVNDLGNAVVEKGFTYYEPPPVKLRNRNFAMGFVPILLGPTQDPYLLHWYWHDARQIAADYGDIVSLLYSVWDHCDGGVPHLTDLSPAINEIQWFHDEGVQVLIGLEITTDIRRNVGFCPGDTFAETHIWDDMESQVRYLFEAIEPGLHDENYPDYLLLGIEMNMYYIARPEDWQNYKDLMEYLYSVIHEYTTRTKVVVSFQYEVMTLRGHLPWNHDYPRQWEIYSDLALDVYGISVYPGLDRFVCFWDPSWNPINKFHLFTDPEYNPRGLPFGITETGYQAYQASSYFDLFCGSELHQHSFLVRTAATLQKKHGSFMIWWSLHEGASTAMPEWFTSMRLITEDRECYADCNPFHPDCESPCPLDPKGSMAFDTWQEIMALPPLPPPHGFND